MGAAQQAGTARDNNRAEGVEMPARSLPSSRWDLGTEGSEGAGLYLGVFFLLIIFTFAGVMRTLVSSIWAMSPFIFAT